jgi:hypothetical protein
MPDREDLLREFTHKGAFAGHANEAERRVIHTLRGDRASDRAQGVLPPTVLSPQVELRLDRTAKFVAALVALALERGLLTTAELDGLLLDAVS